MTAILRLLVDAIVSGQLKINQEICKKIPRDSDELLKAPSIKILDLEKHYKKWCKVNNIPVARMYALFKQQIVNNEFELTTSVLMS